MKTIFPHKNQTVKLRLYTGILYSEVQVHCFPFLLQWFWKSCLRALMKQNGWPDWWAH